MDARIARRAERKRFGHDSETKIRTARRS